MSDDESGIDNGDRSPEETSFVNMPDPEKGSRIINTTQGHPATFSGLELRDELPEDREKARNKANDSLPRSPKDLPNLVDKLQSTNPINPPLENDQN